MNTVPKLNIVVQHSVPNDDGKAGFKGPFVLNVGHYMSELVKLSPGQGLLSNELYIEKSPTGQLNFLAAITGGYVRVASIHTLQLISAMSCDKRYGVALRYEPYPTLIIVPDELMPLGDLYDKFDSVVDNMMANSLPYLRFVEMVDATKQAPT